MELAFGCCVEARFSLTPATCFHPSLVQWMERPNYVEARVPLISDTCFHTSLVQWMEWTTLCWSKVFSQPWYMLSCISCPMDGMDQIMLKQGLFSTLIHAFMHLLSNGWNGPNYVEARSFLNLDTCFHASLVQWMEWIKLCWSKVFPHPH